MKNKFLKKLDALLEEVNETLIMLIQSKGKESKFSNFLCLKIVDEECMFNLDGGRYVVELIIKSRFDETVTLIDDGGYEYSYTCLETTQFVEIADHLIETYSKKK